MMRRKVIAALVGAAALAVALSPGTIPAPALNVGPVTTPTVQVPSLPLPTPPVPLPPTPVTPSPPPPSPPSGGSAPPSSSPSSPAPSAQPGSGGNRRGSSGAPVQGSEQPASRSNGRSRGGTGSPDHGSPTSDLFTNPDGSPTPQNPTFSLASPGPAPLGVPNFFIEKFRIPPFLLPIYQAAGTQYGIPWQVLAAINEIESDYGRNLSVSSAGALGWMQFIPSSWATYGVDANGDGKRDPYNPVDAIFAAARYLRAAGGNKNISQAIFAYNHADWYVQSVLLRAKVIGGMPADLVGSLTGLTQGHFPVAASATYADALNSKKATTQVQSGNAAVADNATSGRRSIDIFSRAGAPVVAVNDGLIQSVGSNGRLGRYVVLQDVYGNTYTYSHLGKISATYPAARQQQPATPVKSDVETPPTDARPSTPASAGLQARNPVAPSSVRGRSAAGLARPVKVRLFAHPSRVASYAAGGDQQVVGQPGPVTGYGSFDNYVSNVLGLHSQDVVLKPLKPGAQVIAGTILGAVDQTDPQVAPHVTFAVRPAGKGAPAIDPKPILDGWKLLEATAIYRASGKNPFWGKDARNPTIGQILLMSKTQLEQRVLSDPHIQIYDCGRRDIQTHVIDRRVLALLEFLSASGLRPYVSTLKCGHSYYVAGGGMVSEHTYGDAADIAMVNGIPISGHQGAGSITDITERRIMTLQGSMQPNQLISLMTYPGVSYAWAQGDHADHIHVGFQPMFGDSAKLAAQYSSALKPAQWVKLIDRLNHIDEPVVPTKPSRYALPAVRGR
jgi:murein DD-endopeptidase MepM/ murein hydrolase activator NlpD